MEIIIYWGIINGSPKYVIVCRGRTVYYCIYSKSWSFLSLGKTWGIKISHLNLCTFKGIWCLYCDQDYYPATPHQSTLCVQQRAHLYLLAILSIHWLQTGDSAEKNILPPMTLPGKILLLQSQNSHVEISFKKNGRNVHIFYMMCHLVAFWIFVLIFAYLYFRGTF